MKASDGFRIIEVKSGKRHYLPLLLTGDESEAMIDRYIDRSTLYVGFLDERPVAVCAVVSIDASTVEVKNLAVVSDLRRLGYGRRMLNHAEHLNHGKKIILGTGETPSTLRFYRSCGYSYSHRIPDFFTDNYPEPIVEEGVTLRDMVYLQKKQSHMMP